MPFQQATAATQEAFIQGVFTFLTSNGWTQDELDTTNDRASIHLTSNTGMAVHFAWNNTDEISIAQSTQTHPTNGFNGPSVAIDQHDFDSGNGNEADTERRINEINNGPFTNYFVHTDTNYAHIVLEYQPGIYRHISFGEITKIGDWTGGEYCTALYLDSGFKDVPLDSRHSVLFDLINTTEGTAGTIHAEGLSYFGGSTKWGLMYGGTTPGLDGDSNARFICAAELREGRLPNAVGWIPANPSNGYVNTFPIHLSAKNVSPSPDEWTPLGTIPDMEGCNMTFLEPQEEFTVGSDTWKVYPWWRKATTGTEQSKSLGIAIKKTA
jgi:hypothetical protein